MDYTLSSRIIENLMGNAYVKGNEGERRVDWKRLGLGLWGHFYALICRLFISICRFEDLEN